MPVEMRTTAALFIAVPIMLLAVLSACQSKKKMPAMNEVWMEKQSVESAVFTLSKVDAQQVNGKLHVAVVSTQGSMFQFNDLDMKAVKSGKIAADAYRVVFLPGGMQSACLGVSAKNKLALKQLADNRWELTYIGAIQCGDETVGVKMHTAFEVPPPTFVAPN